MPEAQPSRTESLGAHVQAGAVGRSSARPRLVLGAGPATACRRNWTAGARFHLDAHGAVRKLPRPRTLRVLGTGTAIAADIRNAGGLTVLDPYPDNAVRIVSTALVPHGVLADR